ncbi:MAG: ribonuclease M5 [Filifactoraceae bacterium]
MIKEVIVVEGKDDISAVKAAVDAEVIATNGFGFPIGVKERIRKAGEKRGLIILTDPDYAGEKIRKTVSKLVPGSKHAYIPQEDASKDGDIGVENASKESIIRALNAARYENVLSNKLFTNKDMIHYGFSMCENASYNRSLVGGILGIGYGNCKQFLSRLNNYGITKEEIEKAIMAIKK